MAIKPEQLKDALITNMKNYTFNVRWDISEASQKWTREGAKWLRKNHALHRTGDYNKGWRVKKSRKGYVIYNSKRPEITHLKEYGHATADGTGWVEGMPHLKPVESQIVGIFEKEVERIIRENGGRK